MDIPILYQDSDVIVINKPSGVVVNRADTVTGETIQDWAEKKLSNNPLREYSGQAIIQFPISNEEQSDFLKRRGIVHRLDKDTSGCLIIAKNEEAFGALQLQFHDRVTKKVYTALLHGTVTPATGSINAPVGRLPWNRQRFGVHPGGREAVTDYQVEKVYTRDGEEYSLVSFFPQTGRTHQLRAHAKYMNHPIVGDPWYTGEKTNRNDSIWCPRLFLHAKSITFVHPVTHQPIIAEAPLPTDLQSALNSLTNQ